LSTEEPSTSTLVGLNRGKTKMKSFSYTPSPKSETNLIPLLSDKRKISALPQENHILTEKNTKNKSTFNQENKTFYNKDHMIPIVESVLDLDKNLSSEYNDYDDIVKDADFLNFYPMGNKFLLAKSNGNFLIN
jgi:hypothetical protein